MSHDFAKNKKKKTSSAKQSSGLPSWFWLFTGLVSGLFIAFLFYLSDITPNSDPANNSPKDNAAEPDLTRQIREQAERLRDGKEALIKPKFEFYTRLPELKIETPKRPLTKKSSEPGKRFMLQAGSFKVLDDADSLKAKLIMQGLDVKIQSVTDNKGTSWHRVQVGPYMSQNKLNKAQDILANNNIPSMLLEVQ